MPHPAGRTSLCSIVFIDIVGFSKVTDAVQLAMKARLNSAIAAAVAKAAESERIILDTGDGAALCFLADPEDALFAATAISGAIKGKRGRGAQRLRIGIHLGPVKLVTDLNGQPNLVGDGINVAQRIMSFAEDGEIAVSRAYYEVVARLRDRNQNLFHYVGTRTDKHIREHQVYAVNDGPHVGSSHADAPAPRAPAARSAPMKPATQAAPLAPAERPRRQETPPPAKPTAARADVPPPDATLPPEDIAAEERRLTAAIGPIAKVVIARAARAAGSLTEFHDLVAAAISDSASRDVFRAKAPSSRDRTAAPAVSPEAPPGRMDDVPDAAPRPSLAAEELATARHRLARYVGPLASILVDRAADATTDRRELYRRLSESIARPPDKVAFLASAGIDG
jgi:class 3 adenylate cyclase